MPTVVGIHLNRASKIYHFTPGRLADLREDEYVVVETSRGRALGRVVKPPHQVAKSELSGELKPVIRRATSWDAVQQDNQIREEPKTLAETRDIVAQHSLPMKVVHLQYNFDGSHLTIFFSAESRIDFRSLVRKLSKTFKTSVEMRQIGVRDEAKLMDGYGRCGYRLCCSSWMTEFKPISIRLAKLQNLPLNPSEISGSCGRLLCCLGYESDAYAEAIKRLPKRRTRVMTRHGEGVVLKVHPIKESVTIRLDNSDTLVEVPADELVTDAQTEKAPAEPKPPRRKKGRSRRRRSSQRKG